MASNEDLLVRLHRWAGGQSENFTTEAFAHVLEHLINAEPAAAARILTWLTAWRIEVTEADVEELEVWCQFWTKDHGTFDLRLRAPDLDIIVEVKLGDGPTADQLNPYRDALELAGKPRRALVGLVGKAPRDPLPGDAVLRLWRDLAEQLKALVAGEQVVDAITEREINQLLQLLGSHRLLPVRRVESPLAEVIERHRQEAENFPERRSILELRVRRLEILDQWPELVPLKCLLGQISDVLERKGLRARLESGQSGQWPWIGYTINNLAYFVELNLDQPQRLTFTRYGQGVDPGSFDKRLGRLERQRCRYRWCNTLDLVEAGYFNLDARGQVALLGEFIESSLTYGERLRPQSDGAS